MRNLLIIHDSKTMLGLLKRYVLSELSDVFIAEAASAEKGLKELEGQTFDTVICANKMKEMDGPDIYRKNQEFVRNKETPFIIVTSSQTGENLEELASHGIEHYLISPFTPQKLRDKIDLVCNPRKMRASDRISIPGAKAVLHFKFFIADAKILNISSSGILCDLTLPKQNSDVMKRANIAIYFPPEYGNVRVENVSVRLLRLNVLTCDEDYIPQDVRVGWQFMDVSEENREVIDHVLKKAMKDFEMPENEGT